MVAQRWQRCWLAKTTHKYTQFTMDYDYESSCPSSKTADIEQSFVLGRLARSVVVLVKIKQVYLEIKARPVSTSCTLLTVSNISQSHATQLAFFASPKAAFCSQRILDPVIVRYRRIFSG